MFSSDFPSLQPEQDSKKKKSNKTLVLNHALKNKGSFMLFNKY